MMKENKKEEDEDDDIFEDAVDYLDSEDSPREGCSLYISSSTKESQCIKIVEPTVSRDANVERF